MALNPSQKQFGSNLQDVKLLNRAVIFRTIREAKAISRAELAKLTGLNPATLTNIARELLDQGLIEEAGLGESRGGRRSSLLRIRSDLGFIIAVRISRHNIQGLITNLDLQNITTYTITSLSLSHPVEITLPALLDLIETLTVRSGVGRRSVLGIGICAPGPLDAQQGVLVSPPNFPGWPSTPIRQIVEEKTGLATFLDNDANSAALAEKWFGAGRKMDNYAYILAEDGVGGGLVMNGDIYRGAHDAAGEIGHATIDLNGLRCDCGNFGCLELYASPRAAEDFVRLAIERGDENLDPSWMANALEPVTFDRIVQAALTGDAMCRRALQNIASALSIAVVNLINTFDPEAVILGGKIITAGSLILPIIQDIVYQRVLARGAQSIPIILSELGQDAPVIGAFSLVLRELFQNPEYHALVNSRP